MDVAEDHKSRKLEQYWGNLVAGETGVYKAAAIDELISRHFPKACDAILDIGCGTSVIATTLRNRLGATRLVFMDYDQAIIEEMRKQTHDDTIEWVVGDIFKVGSWAERFDLILLLDMIHEVYSFYGRPVREVKTEIDHSVGQQAVRRALEQVAQITNRGGGIVITDNVLSPEDGSVVVEARNPLVMSAVGRFLQEYPSRRIRVEWLGESRFRIGLHDFNILLTQYNKIKSNQEDRWNVERFEIHQYMTERELRDTFADLGFTMHALVGTPEGTAREWSEDFTIVEGVVIGLPMKRITLLAIKDR